MKVRIANNKNIQTMEQKDIDVYEILKDVPKGTEFYTSLCGNVGLAYLESNKEAGEAIWTKNKDGEYSFNKNGRWMKGGEVTFFPSKQMRDWSKFFKKGDVLEYAGDDEGLQGSCTFEKFEDETKTRFLGRYVKEKEALYSKRPSSLRTADWVKSDDPADYIRFVEERLGGKLNRKTLEIEKTQPAFKTFDKVLVRDGGEYEWLPALFVRDRREGANYRYKVLSLRSGKPAEFACCIPYEGNENIIFTDHNIDDLPF